MTTTLDVSDRLARYARTLGYTVYRQGSRLSRSEYLAITLLDESEDELLVDVKIRISDHALPPSYAMLNGSADYEVVTGKGHDEAHGDWIACLAWLAEKAGRGVASLPKGATWARVRNEMLGRRRRRIARRLCPLVMAEVSAEITEEREAAAQALRDDHTHRSAAVEAAVAANAAYLREVRERLAALGKTGRRTLRKAAAARLGLDADGLNRALYEIAANEG